MQEAVSKTGVYATSGEIIIGDTAVNDLDPGERGLGMVYQDGAVGISGTARLLEPLGDVTLVHFDAAEGRSLVAKVAPGSQLAPGAPLRFCFLPERCRLFDLASGQRRG